MSIIQALMLGIIQGLGEFLPISSTAHLVLAPYFFGWQDPGLAFDVALHLGTLIAVVSYFFNDWVLILKNVLVEKEKQKTNFFWFIVIATIPGVLAGYFLENKAETVFRSPLIIAFTLSFVGLILYLSDKFSKKEKDIKNINFLDAIIIGLSQAVAIIPGVSRAGATITAGLFRKLDRVSAARFSFILSTPIILGAVVLKLPELFRAGINMQIIFAILTSAVSGYWAIKYLLKFVEKSSYAVFFWYRLILAVLIVVFYYFIF